MGAGGLRWAVGVCRCWQGCSGGSWRTARQPLLVPSCVRGACADPRGAGGLCSWVSGFVWVGKGVGFFLGGAAWVWRRGCRPSQCRVVVSLVFSFGRPAGVRRLSRVFFVSGCVRECRVVFAERGSSLPRGVAPLGWWCRPLGSLVPFLGRWRPLLAFRLFRAGSWRQGVFWSVCLPALPCWPVLVWVSLQVCGRVGLASVCCLFSRALPAVSCPSSVPVVSVRLPLLGGFLGRSSCGGLA